VPVAEKQILSTERILEDLQKLADPRAIETWEKIGMSTKHYIGVDLSKLRNYSKRMKKNHALVLDLWATGIHDARLLATMIEDPKDVTEVQLDSWVNEADYFDITDRIVQDIVPNTPFAGSLMRKWLKSKKEYVRRTGWMTVSFWGCKTDELTDKQLAKYLEKIEKEIHAEKNWVKEAMNMTLINIGGRGKTLQGLARQAAKRIGKIEVDYGESSGKVPDALLYLSTK
jgi:3-methyladenine DNA glycosylase AlkD